VFLLSSPCRDPAPKFSSGEVDDPVVPTCRRRPPGSATPSPRRRHDAVRRTPHKRRSGIVSRRRRAPSARDPVTDGQPGDEGEVDRLRRGPSSSAPTMSPSPTMERRGRRGRHTTRNPRRSLEERARAAWTCVLRIRISRTRRDVAAKLAGTRPDRTLECEPGAREELSLSMLPGSGPRSGG